MVSVVSICNVALSNIGKGTISDLNEASAEAAQCRLHYATTRDIMLQSYPWRFATKAQSLAEMTNDWDSAWQYAYKRPGDCLKPLLTAPELGAIIAYRGEYCGDTLLNPLGYGVRADRIYCDYSPASLAYIYRVEDPTRFPPLFQEALSWSLASKIAMPLTRDQSIRKDAYQIAAQSMGAAQVADANEEQTVYDQQSAFMASRY